MDAATWGVEEQMKVFVSAGRAGAAQAAERGRVAIVVDALRASATTASLLHYGAREIVVVEEVSDAFAEHDRRPGSWLVGERGGVAVPGFDRGNSPLQAPVPGLPETIVFSSSNMSRCCVGASACPAAFLGTLPTLTACARVALDAARQHGTDLHLIPAGSALDENKLVLEDYITAGALIERMRELEEGLQPAEDAAHAALTIHAAARRASYEAAFHATDNGTPLRDELGLGDDVSFAARVDVFAVVPRVTGTFALPSGRVAAVLQAATLA